MKLMVKCTIKSFSSKNNNNNNATQFSKAQFTLEMEGGVNTCKDIKFLLLVRFAFMATKKHDFALTRI